MVDQNWETVSRSVGVNVESSWWRTGSQGGIVAWIRGVRTGTG